MIALRLYARSRASRASYLLAGLEVPFDFKRPACSKPMRVPTLVHGDHTMIES